MDSPALTACLKHSEIYGQHSLPQFVLNYRILEDVSKNYVKWFFVLFF